MQRYRLFAVLGFLFAFNLAYSGSPARAATPAFTLTASNVTMSSTTSSGVGSSSFTLASLNGYAGIVGINCSAPTPPAGSNVPICDFGGPAWLPYPVSANQTTTGTVVFRNSAPPCNPCPVSLPLRRGHRPVAPGLALAGVLLLGFSFRRRAARWLTAILLAAGTLASLAGISACGGNNSVVMPGTYAYTITAMDTNTSVRVTTTINVTVP